MLTRCQSHPYATYIRCITSLTLIRRLWGRCHSTHSNYDNVRLAGLSNLQEAHGCQLAEILGFRPETQASQLWLTCPNLRPLCSLFPNKDLQIFENYPSSIWQCAGLSPKPSSAEWRGICELAEARPCRRRLPTSNKGGPGLPPPSPRNTKSCASLHGSSSTKLLSYSLTPWPYPWPIHIS